MFDLNIIPGRWVVKITILAAAMLAAALLGACTGSTSNQPAANNPHNEAAEHKPADGHETKLNYDVPASLKAEHRELHEELEKAVQSGGKTGEAAKVVEQLLSEHFENEEKFALPQLGLLTPIAEGKVTPDMKPAIDLSDRLKADLPKMLEEHKGIVEALNNLSSAAKAENKPQALKFAETLTAHAQNEEQVMYPAAILVGEYLKLKLK
jgi:hypothetical protein